MVKLCVGYACGLVSDQSNDRSIDTCIRMQQRNSYQPFTGLSVVSVILFVQWFLRIIHSHHLSPLACFFSIDLKDCQIRFTMPAVNLISVAIAFVIGIVTTIYLSPSTDLSPYQPNVVRVVYKPQNTTILSHITAPTFTQSCPATFITPDHHTTLNHSSSTYSILPYRDCATDAISQETIDPKPGDIVPYVGPDGPSFETVPRVMDTIEYVLRTIPVVTFWLLALFVIFLFAAVLFDCVPASLREPQGRQRANDEGRQRPNGESQQEVNDEDQEEANVFVRGQGWVNVGGGRRTNIRSQQWVWVPGQGWVFVLTRNMVYMEGPGWIRLERRQEVNVEGKN